MKFNLNQDIVNDYTTSVKSISHHEKNIAILRQGIMNNYKKDLIRFYQDCPYDRQISIDQSWSGKLELAIEPQIRNEHVIRFDFTNHSRINLEMQVNMTPDYGDYTENYELHNQIIKWTTENIYKYIQSYDNTFEAIKHLQIKAEQAKITARLSGDTIRRKMIEQFQEQAITGGVTIEMGDFRGEVVIKGRKYNDYEKLISFKYEPVTSRTGTLTVFTDRHIDIYEKYSIRNTTNAFYYGIVHKYNEY